jgi:hypothetical protein
MGSILLPSLLALLLPWTLLCLVLNASTLQVDLVFPRNNTIYKPVYPFPIVFAIHNLPSAWNYKPYIRWSLWTYRFDSIPGSVTDGIGDGVIGFDITSNDGFPPRTPPPPATFLKIESVSGLINATKLAWYLKYTIAIGRTCTGPGFYDPNSSDYERLNFRSGVITFNVSNTVGVVPDVTAGGDCPTTLGAITFQGPNQSNPECPVLSIPQPAPELCAYKVNSDIAMQVTSSMINKTECNGTTWPNTTILNRCLRKHSGATINVVQHGLLMLWVLAYVAALML